MNKKILFLIILFLPCASSCAPLKKNNKLNKPPADHFVKVFKELEITRCLKKPKPKTKPCETKTFFSRSIPRQIGMRIFETQRLLNGVPHKPRGQR